MEISGKALPGAPGKTGRKDRRKEEVKEVQVIEVKERKKRRVLSRGAEKCNGQRKIALVPRTLVKCRVGYPLRSFACGGLHEHPRLAAAVHWRASGPDV